MDGGDTGKKQWNTKIKTEPRVTQIFIKQHAFFIYKCFLYRVRKIEKLG